MAGWRSAAYAGEGRRPLNSREGGFTSRGEVFLGQLMPPVRRPSLGRRAWQAQPSDRGVLRCAAVRRTRRLHARGERIPRPRCAQHLGKERPILGIGAGEPGRRGRGGAARRRRPENRSQYHCSDTKISKILNRSAQGNEYKSCRSNYPLQLSKRS
jgi:hypothetical protein